MDVFQKERCCFTCLVEHSDALLGIVCMSRAIAPKRQRLRDRHLPATA